MQCRHSFGSLPKLCASKKLRHQEIRKNYWYNNVYYYYINFHWACISLGTCALNQPMHMCKITANRCKFITNRSITLLLWILFHSCNFTIYTVNNVTEMIGSEFCLKKKPTSLNNLAYFGRSFSPTHFWRSKLITFEIRVIFNDEAFLSRILTQKLTKLTLHL